MSLKAHLLAAVVVLVLAATCSGGNLDGFTIVVDPGHGRNYPGASGAAGESTATHWIGTYLAETLRQRGAKVHLTPSSLNATERAMMANRVGADLLISIHGDDSSNRFGRGVQTLYEHSRSHNDAGSRDAAGIVQGSLVSILGRHGASDQGFGVPGPTRTGVSSLGVLREARVPAVLVEIGMARGSSIRQRLDMEVGQMRNRALSTRGISADELGSLHIVQGLARGVETYLTRQSASTTAQPGGVLLDKPAEALWNLSNIRGAMLHRSSGRLYLVGERKTLLPALIPGYFQTALRCAAQHEGPGVSIDPGISSSEMTVRYIGPVQDTALGKVMFEADRLLKCLSLGRDNVSNQEMSCPIAGFRTLPEILGRTLEANGSGPLARFWFVPRRLTLQLSFDGDAVMFRDVELELKAEVLDVSASQAVKDAAREFAEFVTAHFGEFSLEYPVLAELKQIAQAAALAHWIVDNDIAVPGSLLSGIAGQADTPIATPAVGVGVSSSLGDWQGVQIIGGVDLSYASSAIKYSRGFGAARLVQSGIDQRGVNNCVWTFEHEGECFECVALEYANIDVLRYGWSPRRVRSLLAVGLFLVCAIVFAWKKRL